MVGKWNQFQHVRKKQGFFFYVGRNKNKNKISWLADVGREKMKKGKRTNKPIIFNENCHFLRKRQVNGTNFSMSEKKNKKMLRWLLFFRRTQFQLIGGLVIHRIQCEWPYTHNIQTLGQKRVTWQTAGLVFPAYLQQYSYDTIALCHLHITYDILHMIWAFEYLLYVIQPQKCHILCANCAHFYKNCLNSFQEFFNQGSYHFLPSVCRRPEYFGVVKGAGQFFFSVPRGRTRIF